jgi:cytochrome c peroxidase
VRRFPRIPLSMRATVFAAAVAGAAPACKKEPPPPPPAPDAAEPAKAAEALAPAELDPARLAAFGALPERFENPANPITPAKVALGKQLYFDPRLSKNHDVSCNSCHDLAMGGVDGKPTSPGHKGQLGGRNSPTSLNAAGHFVQFWDGRAADVEAQAKGPVLNPGEMAMPSAAAVEKVLASILGYVTAFKEAFPESKKPTFDDMALAIAAFERTLVTPSRWDRYLGGDKAALTAEEKAGFNTFVETGCISCHTGALVGGGMYQKAGLVKPWPNQKDQGRFDLTKVEADKMFFKVPSLRNIEKTAPYFHDGSVATLPEAVKTMASHQLGKELGEPEVAGIVAWLKTLTGELAPGVGDKPELPPSGPKTPKPDPS